MASKEAKRMTRTELIAALEAAEGPSRELDAEIALANGWSMVREVTREVWTTPSGNRCYYPPRYTESIDAALSFKPEGWRVMEISQAAGPSESWRCKLSRRRDGLIVTEAPDNLMGAATPAIALCIANLRALEAQEEA